MKKQILILILVLFALGVSTAYAQFEPREIPCIDLDDPLRPVPGNPYTYEVTIPSPPGNNSFRWWVLQNEPFVTGGTVNTNFEPIGGDILYSAETNYNVMTPNNNSITIVWQSIAYDPTEPIFVVVHVMNDGAGGSLCGTMNLKAYKIEPIHAFTLDIANVDEAGNIQAGYGTDDLTQCVSEIWSAEYDMDEYQVVYDFGEDTLYYAVIAANWNDRWQLSVQFDGLEENQTADIYWGYTHGATTNLIDSDIAAPGGTITSTDLVLPLDPENPSIGAEGEIIHIMVVIKHDNFEHIAQKQYTLAVNGQLHDGTDPIVNMYDVHHICIGDPPTTQMLEFSDIALQSIAPRPAVTVPVGAPDFLPIAP